MDMTFDKQVTLEYANALVHEAFHYAVPDFAMDTGAVPLDAAIETLGIQSIEALEMAGYLEEKLKIQFSDEDLINIRKLDDLVTLVLQHSSHR